MVATTQQEISEGRVFYIGGATTPSLRISGGRVFAVYNLPAIEQRISQARIYAVASAPGVQEISEARVFAIVRGRVANTHLRVWKFTLDGHDNYVLRLGDFATLVYDTYSEQWVEWTSPELPFWRATSGMNWIGGEALAGTYGSNIVAGDDLFGLLWFLDPEQPYDEHPDEARVPQQLAFERIITGQVVARGREFIPCYALFLDGDNYGLVATDFTPGVTLETSDDQGRTFDAHETITVTADTADQAYEWLSLGQIASPGRIFRITDNGVFTRIDSLEMNDDAR